LGLVTYSSLPPSHWKNLFYLDLVKQRNKPKEPPKKPPKAPFFLQWRGEATQPPAQADEEKESENKEEDEWNAVWDDDDEEQDEKNGTVASIPDAMEEEKKEIAEKKRTLPLGQKEAKKRPKVTHARSHLAALLQQQSDDFSAVTAYMATLGPSAIDVALSSLCFGTHDQDEGIPLLHLACRWLLQECKSCERFECIQAYLHRFLHLHSIIIAGIEQPNTPLDTRRRLLLQSIQELRKEQRRLCTALKGKINHTLCLLRHFTRMV